MVEVVMALLFGFIGAFAGAFCATFLLLRYLTLQRGEYQQEVVQEVKQCPMQEEGEWGQADDTHYFLNSTVLRHWWLGSSPPQDKRGGEG